MIYYDITKMGAARHRSGLMRVTSRLQQELGSLISAVRWDGERRCFVRVRWKEKTQAPVAFAADDWLLTVELFSDGERPGFAEFVAARPCRLAAMFHDAIPLRWPHITWPQSVQRHPGYMKLLAGFDRVLAISEASRDDLVGFWRWQGVTPRAEVTMIELGADFDGGHRASRDPRILRGRAGLLCVGIIEPRKNQAFLVDVAAALWRDGVDFDLHIVGRVNPHFGQPILAKIRAMQKTESRLKLHEAASDDELGALFTNLRAVVFPTIAEGCGLPLLEALWRGVPCVCSDLAVLRENARAGGCVTARVNDLADWSAKLRAVLTDAELNLKLQREAMARPLVRWTETAHTLRKALK